MPQYIGLQNIRLTKTTGCLARQEIYTSKPCNLDWRGSQAISSFHQSRPCWWQTLDKENKEDNRIQIQFYIIKTGKNFNLKNVRSKTNKKSAKAPEKTTSPPESSSK
jgi:hypothetical protein